MFVRFFFLFSQNFFFWYWAFCPVPLRRPPLSRPPLCRWTGWAPRLHVYALGVDWFPPTTPTRPAFPPWVITGRGGLNYPPESPFSTHHHWATRHSPHQLTPPHASARPRTPPHTSPRLRTPTHASAHLLTPPYASARPRTPSHTSSPAYLPITIHLDFPSPCTSAYLESPQGLIYLRCCAWTTRKPYISRVRK